MAIATNKSRVYATLGFLNELDNMYIALGKTTPWENENQPPQEDPNATDVQELIGFKRVTKGLPCRKLGKDQEPKYPTVTYGGSIYELIPTEKAFEENADKAYLEVSINEEDLPLGKYRQVGIYTGLQSKTGAECLLPKDVVNNGVLQILANIVATDRTKGVTIKERFVVSMTNNKQIKGEI